MFLFGVPPHLTTIANLLVEVGADISGFMSGMGDVNNTINRTGGGMAEAGQKITGMGAKVTAITAPLAIMGGIGLKTAADFEATMTEISARTGIVGTDLQNVRDFALQMGADTSFSGQQAADAFLQLLSSGQTAQQALETLPSILDAAAAGGEDLGHTADVVTDIMAAFGIGVEYSSDVVDSLAKAAGASSADMSSLGQGFGNIGGIARSFGISMNRTAAILAILSENGIKGGEAGTALKSMLLNMTRPTEDVQGAWNDLGVSFYDGQGNTRDLTAVMGDLKTAMKDLPAEQQNEMMTTLFGSYGRTAAEALMGSMSIEQMEEAMRNSAGAADVADARMNTFTGRVDSLKGSVETLMIRALTPFMDNVLSPLAVTLTDVVNRITDWTVANPGLTDALVKVGAVALVAGPALIAIGTAMTLAAPAVTALGIAFGLLLSPIGLAAAAIIGIGALVASGVIDFSGFGQRIQTGLRDTLANLNLPGIDTSGLQNSLSQAFADLELPTLDLSTFQASVQDSFSGLDFSGIEPVMDTHFNDILNAIISVVGIVFGGPIGIAIGAARLVGMAISNNFLGIGDFLDTSGIGDAVSTAFTDLKTTIDTIIQGVFSGGQAAQIGDGIHSFLTDAAGGGEGASASGPLQLFISDLQRGFDALKTVVGDVWNNIKPGFDDLVVGVQGFINAFADTDTEGLLRVVTGIGAVIGGLVAGAAEIGSAALGQLFSAVGEALPALGSGISNLISALSAIGQGDIGQFATDIGTAVTDIVNAVLDFAGIDITVPDFSKAIEGWQTAFDSIKTIIDTVGSAITTKFNEFVGTIRGIINTAIGLFIQTQIAFTDLIIGVKHLTGVDASAEEAFKVELYTRLDNLNSKGIPSFKTGGKMASTGPAFLHAGERVLNPSQTKDYESGSGGRGGNQSVVINGAMDVDKLLFDLRVRGIDLQAMAE